MRNCRGVSEAVAAVIVVAVAIAVAAAYAIWVLHLQGTYMKKAGDVAIVKASIEQVGATYLVHIEVRNPGTAEVQDVRFTIYYGTTAAYSDTIASTLPPGEEAVYDEVISAYAWNVQVPPGQEVVIKVMATDTATSRTVSDSITVYVT